MVFLSSPSLELTKVCISMEEHTSPLSALVRDLDGGGCNGGGTLVFRVRIPQRDLPKSMSTGCLVSFCFDLLLGQKRSMS